MVNDLAAVPSCMNLQNININQNEERRLHQTQPDMMRSK